MVLSNSILVLINIDAYNNITILYYWCIAPVAQVAEQVAQVAQVAEQVAQEDEENKENRAPAGNDFIYFYFNIDGREWMLIIITLFYIIDV